MGKAERVVANDLDGGSEAATARQHMYVVVLTVQWPYTRVVSLELKNKVGRLARARRIGKELDVSPLRIGFIDHGAIPSSSADS